MKILVIKTSALGDILHVFPALQYIRKLYPEAVIDWVVEESCASLVEAHPFVNQVYVVKTKCWRRLFYKASTWAEMKKIIAAIRKINYDAVFDFQGNIKSGIIMGVSRGGTKIGFGRKSVPEIPNLIFSNFRVNPLKGKNIREDYLALVEAWSDSSEKIENLPHTLLKGEFAAVKKDPSRFQVMVCPGSKWPNKQLSMTALTAFLLIEESKRPCQFWIIQNSPQEKQTAEYFKRQLKEAAIVDPIPLPQLQHLMKQMDLVVAMDSLPLHLAGEANVPTFSFFGPSLAEKYRPMGSIHQSMQGKCPYHQQFEKRCPLLRTCPTGACMLNIQPLRNPYAS